jgi:hypothetical protein
MTRAELIAKLTELCRRYGLPAPGADPDPDLPPDPPFRPAAGARLVPPPEEPVDARGKAA